jgi:hypothetical protein
VLQPLRVETVVQLAAIKDSELAQSWTAGARTRRAGIGHPTD